MYISPLFHGRPADPTGRLPKELAVYDLLDSLSVPYTRVDHDVTDTIEACHEVDTLLGATICKNLFLCNQNKTAFYLLMMPGEKRFKTKIFSSLIGSSRLSFAPAEYMEEYLGITPGSVSVLGLMNDRENRVKLYVDADVLKAPDFGCHPCINTSSLGLSTADLIQKLLPAMGHGYETVELPWNVD